MNRRRIFYPLIILMIPAMMAGQSNKPVTNYLGVNSPIVFDNVPYLLSWSTHPADNFYKQEYLQKGVNADRFTTMLLLDLLAGENDIKSIVSKKVVELNVMKETNPVVNYEMIRNPATGEYLLDFLLTANAPDGTIAIVERNVYRYSIIVDKAGRKSTLLFGVSSRQYGAAADKFIAALKGSRKILVNKVAQFKIPALYSIP